MMRRIIAAVLASVLASGVQAWDEWEAFKAANIDNGRVVDYSDSRRVTTSEGQSYAMFFALAAGDRETFEALLRWTETNLARGDITKALPSWLWGENAGRWTIIDSNNAVDSDMWIAYCLLEAGRLWGCESCRSRGLAMMELLKTQVRDVARLGRIMLPGRKGFETPETIKVNPSYYPLFLLRRFALEDSYWESVCDGSLKLLLRTAPNGFSPDWARISRTGRLQQPKDEDERIGSYNSIRVYLWAGLTSKSDPSYGVLKEHFEPMVRATRELNMPPEKVDVVNLRFYGTGPTGFGACLLPWLGKGKDAAWMRSLLKETPIAKDSYYSNVLALFGLGFDEGVFSFDADGRVVLPAAAAPGAKER